MAALIEIDNACVSFHMGSGLFQQSTEVKAMDHVTLSVNSGEVVALVGESGCGKTTLGRAVTGLQRPTHGEIRYNGKNIWELNHRDFGEYRRDVQMMMQDSYAALNPMRSVEQSLTLPLSQAKVVRGRRNLRRRVIELLESVGLTPGEQFLTKYPHQLSGGQRQRVCLARAISLNPKVIVADEPVSAVDVSLRLSILNLMGDLNRQMGIAFLYITHDLSTARYIANQGRMVGMYLGRIVEIGSVEDVISHPRHPYLRALMAAVPVPDPKVAKQNRVKLIKGIEMPDAANPPSGCAFHPRCPLAVEACSQSIPEIRRVGRTEVACHLAEEVPAWIPRRVE